MSEIQIAIPLFIAAQAGAALAFLGLSKRRVPGAVPFAVLMGVSAWISLAVALGLLAEAATAKYAWLRIQYIAIVLSPAAWLALTLQLRANVTRLSDKTLALLAIEPVLMLMFVWTNGVHGLVWSAFAIDESAALSVLALSKGPVFWVHYLYWVSTMVAGITLLVMKARQGDSSQRLQSTLLIAGGLLMIQGAVASVSGFVPFGLDGLPLSTLISGAAIGAALFRQTTQSALPIARDAVMDGLADSAIIVDETGRVIDMNEAAETLTENPADRGVGLEASELLSKFGDLGAQAPLPNVRFSEIEGSTGTRYYEIRTSQLYKADTKSRGRLIVIRDSTSQHQAEGNLHEAVGLLQEQFKNQTSALTQELQERKIAELALRESEARARQVVDTAYDAFVAMNANGTIVDWNPRAEEVFGWPSEDSLGKDYADHILPNRDRESHRRGLRYYLTSGEWPLLDRPVEMIARHADGHEFEAEMTMSAGTVEGVRIFNAFIHDITERKAAEQALRASNSQLEKALTDLESALQVQVEQERLRALGQMASGIAHEFNNALSPIVGFSELLMIRPNILKDEVKARRYLEGISTAAKDAANVVSRLREFYRSRETSESGESIDLNALVSQTVTLTQPKWRNQAQANGASVRVATDLAGHPLIDGDPSAVREVVTNLIFNAVDAMPEGGRVLIHTAEENGKVFLQVIDDGTGMPEEVRRRCLDPFFSTKGEKGTGLGLSLVHGIVQRHGGTMDIQSQEGEGTTFTLEFPVGQIPEESAKTIELAPRAGRALRILAVDDDRAVLEVIEAILEADEHQVVLANSAREGLDELKNETFDVVLTDLAMPMMNGDKFAQLIKRLHPGVPVVMLTGFAETLQQSEFAASVDTVLSKPVSPGVLREALELVLPAAA